MSRRMHILPVMLLASLLLSCTKERQETGRVYFSTTQTKTHIGASVASVLWDESDKVQLWAKNSGGSFALQNQTFHVYGLDGATAIFTSDLGSPMSTGTYTYYAASPTPDNVDILKATFTVPATQDGTGQGIMIATPSEGKELSADPAGCLSLQMKQKLHLLEFYFPAEEALVMGGESIQRIEATFSKNVVGQVEIDVQHPDDAAVLKSGASQTLTLDLSAHPLPPSEAGHRVYAYATIIPTEFADGDLLQMKLFSETRIANASPIHIGQRTMAEGHATPVRISPNELKERCKVYLNFNTNNIGEKINSITLTAPSGCHWGDGGSNVYVFDPGDAGTVSVIEYEEADDFRTLSGKSITATYDSDHTTFSQTLSFPNVQSVSSASLDFDTGWILNEDFHSVSTFSSSDAYSSTFNSGSKNAYSFLSGWTGGRIGASGGQSIRIACRRETSADYPARVDSAPLNVTLKNNANLKVEFDYGANNQYSKSIVTDGNVGQTAYVGYTTASTAYKSGDTDGEYESGNNFYLKEYTGSYTSLPNHAEYVLHNVNGSLIRLAIRTEIEHKAGTTNTTCWLYIDNVKITINNN